MPRFSVILPVKNGSQYISSCIDSVLKQTFQDFELVILENQSTDDTLDIISSYEDNRIKIYPSKEPLNMEENWHRALHVPKQEYLTLIGHDDLLDPNYLEVMSRLIDVHPKASLYQAHFRYIDEAGNEMSKCSVMSSSYDPSGVIRGFLNSEIDLIGTGFMMRSSDYHLVGGIPSYPGLLFADMQLFIALGVKSYLAVAAEECFSYRRHQNSTTFSATASKLLIAFRLLVNYLHSQITTDVVLANAIKDNSTEFLRRYCQAISHKILKTGSGKGDNLTVEQVLNEFRNFGKLLEVNFEPLDHRWIKAGYLISKNSLLTNIFRKYKRLIPGNILHR